MENIMVMVFLKLLKTKYIKDHLLKILNKAMEFSCSKMVINTKDNI